MRNDIALAPTRSRRESGQRAQRGIGLVLVLFLLVVVSLLAAALVELDRGGSNAVAIEVQSARALLAAESGAQLAAMTIFPISGATPACPGDFSRTFTAGALSSCTAALTCSSTVATDHTVFTVTSTGTCGSGDSYARRQVTIGLRSL